MVSEVTYSEAQAITDTLAEIESGADCSAKGASGEKGCHQYMPATWELYSTKVFGDVVELTPENENTVTTSIIQGWLDEGYTPEEIFLLWNQGDTDECSRGVNKYGVHYDSCSYVKRALELLYEKRTSLEH